MPLTEAESLSAFDVRPVGSSGLFIAWTYCRPAGNNSDVYATGSSTI